MVAIGDTGKAREYAETATKIVDGLLAKDAQRFDWRLLRAQSRMVLGDVTFWDGSDAAIAKAQFSGAIDELEAIAATKSDDNSINTYLLSSYENLGDAARALGDFAGAATAFTDWLDTATTLASKARDPVEPTTGCPTPPGSLPFLATSRQNKGEADRK